MQVRKVGEGAYFVTSYSEQTIMPFQPIITSQTVIAKEPIEDVITILEVEEDEVESEDAFASRHFQETLKKASPSA